MESVSLPCEYIDDEELFVGEQVVTCEEQSGICETTIMVTYENGEETGREVIDREMIVTPVSEQVHIGIKEKPLYILPVCDYVFTSGYGARWGTTHYGIDLAVPTGTDVMAAADGRVIQSGWNGGYGISVYLEHDDGSITRYGHMSETLVTVGEYVTQGSVIGLSGNTGDSTGPHVHFEIRIEDAAVDPCGYFDEL
jgi:murein DD-endopeptidase MepM/ murein hydrolase activator NlpD